MGIGTTFLVSAFIKLACAGGVGIGASSLLKFFHEYEFKNKKKGDKNAIDHSESLRERAKGLS